MISILQMGKWDIRWLRGHRAREQAAEPVVDPESSVSSQQLHCTASHIKDLHLSTLSLPLPEPVVFSGNSKNKSDGILPTHKTRVGNRLEFWVTEFYTVQIWKSPNHTDHFLSPPHKSRNWHLEWTSWPTSRSRSKARTEFLLLQAGQCRSTWNQPVTNRGSEEKSNRAENTHLRNQRPCQ